MRTTVYSEDASLELWNNNISICLPTDHTECFHVSWLWSMEGGSEDTTSVVISKWEHTKRWRQPSEQVSVFTVCRCRRAGTTEAYVVFCFAWLSYDLYVRGPCHSLKQTMLCALTDVGVFTFYWSSICSHLIPLYKILHQCNNAEKL